MGVLVLETSTIYYLGTKIRTNYRESQKKGFPYFLKDDAKTFFKVKILLEERETKRVLRERLQKCPFGRLLWI